MSMPIIITDRNGIKLFLNDIVIDEFGTEWILSYENETFIFALKDGKVIKETLPITDSPHMYLKHWK